MTTMALSYSRLSTFEQCQAKFEYLYVSKRVKDSDNEFTLYGNRVHEALEEYAKDSYTGVALALDMLDDGQKYAEIRKFLPVADAILARPGQKFFELQMAIREDKTPCDWFAPDVWLRGIADVLVVNGDTAFVGDWKTGKVKENLVQLKLFACMVFALFPQVNKVKTAFIWLVHDQITDATFTRNMLPDLWATIEPRLSAVQDSVDVGVFKPKPSGLCNWCPAKGICPDRKTR